MDDPNFHDARTVNGHYNEAFDPSDEVIKPHDDPESGCVVGAEEEMKAIVYTKVERLEPRDFVSEIRPQLDIKHYFDSIQVLLDSCATSPNEVVKRLLEKVRILFMLSSDIV